MGRSPPANAICRTDTLFRGKQIVRRPIIDLPEGRANERPRSLPRGLALTLALIAFALQVAVEERGPADAVGQMFDPGGDSSDSSILRKMNACRRTLNDVPTQTVVALGGFFAQGRQRGDHLPKSSRR